MQLAAFYVGFKKYIKVVERLKRSWEGCAKHWAWWGRLDVLHMGFNTNNLCERFFGMLKYTDLGGKAQLPVPELMLKLVTVVTPRYIQNRGHMLAGRVTSDQQKQAQRQAVWVEKLVASGSVEAVEGSIPGLTRVQRGEDEPAVIVCLGDLSCSCNYSSE